MSLVSTCSSSCGSVTCCCSLTQSWPAGTVYDNYEAQLMQCKDTTV
jgi:hypothetical protein